MMQQVFNNLYIVYLAFSTTLYLIPGAAGRQVQQGASPTASPSSAGALGGGGRAMGYRSGGHPKFPSNYAVRGPPRDRPHYKSSSGECGQRRVFHNLEKKGRGPTGRIIGGSETPYGAYPWTVNIELRYGKMSHHQCGGAIIGAHHILTAAHCVVNFDPSDLTVKVGDSSRAQVEELEQTFQVEKFRTHPDFQSTGAYSNDLAVLKIKSPKGEGISSTRAVAAACLPDETTSSYGDDSWCYVTGWGVTSTEAEDKTDRLQAARIPILSAEVCRKEAVHGTRSFGPGMICAGFLQGAVDSCIGDSGGPLVCDKNGSFTVLGIVSWGSGCALPNKPGVYTDVRYFRDWILDTMQKL